MHLWSHTTIAEITDGTANTTYVAETNVDQEDPQQFNYSWCPKDDTCYVGMSWAHGNHSVAYCGINPPNQEWAMRALNSQHPGGANLLFVDGHVSFISEEIEQKMLDALVTREGGETIPAGTY